MKRTAIFRIILTLLVLACLCFAVSCRQGAGSENMPGEYDENGLCFTLNEDRHSYRVSNGRCTDENVVIPSVFKGKLVTEIVPGAFLDCAHLKSVTIPESVTVIGNGAFVRCKKLTEVSIPESVTTIGDSAFAGCTGLVSVTISEGVSDIGNSAFSGCIGLTSVTIPNSVTAINNHAFSDCEKLNAVYITDIAAWCRIAFGDYSANPLLYAHNLYLNGELVTDLNIPEDVTVIRAWVFNGCAGLTSVTIPSSVVTIGSFSFEGCTGLASVTISQGVTIIDDLAFSHCIALTSVNIPDSVTFGGNMAFGGCDESLFQIADGMKYVDNWVVDSDKTLTTA